VRRCQVSSELNAQTKICSDGAGAGRATMSGFESVLLMGHGEVASHSSPRPAGSGIRPPLAHTAALPPSARRCAPREPVPRRAPWRSLSPFPQCCGARMVVPPLCPTFAIADVVLAVSGGGFFLFRFHLLAASRRSRTPNGERRDRAGALNGGFSRPLPAAPPSPPSSPPSTGAPPIGLPPTPHDN